MPVDEPNIKVMIASPGGLDDERDLVDELAREAEDGLLVHSRYGFRVLRWEEEPVDYGAPQPQLDPMAEHCDVFVGILGSRLGTPTEAYESGFVEEFEIAARRRRRSTVARPRIWVFVKDSVVDHYTVDLDQLKAVRTFVEGIQASGEVFVKHYKDLDEFEKAVRRQFQRYIAELLTQLPPDRLPLTGQAGSDIKVPIAGSTPSRDSTAEKDLDAVGEEQGLPPAGDDDEGMPPATSGTPNAERPGQSDGSDEGIAWEQLIDEQPVRDAGLLELQEQAEESIDEDPAKAAAALSEVGRALRQHGAGALAERNLARAATLLEQAGDRAGAADLLEQLIMWQLERGSSLADMYARRLLHSLDDEDKWRGAALLAMSDWPEGTEWAREALGVAVARMPASNPFRTQYIAQLTSLLSMSHEYEAVINLAGRGGPLSGQSTESDIDIALDVADALEAIRSITEPQRRWDQLLELADSLADSRRATAARIWQRRGVALAVRGDVEASREAFGRAIFLWRGVAGAEDQVREAYFAHEIAGGLNGSSSSEAATLRPVVAELRGVLATAATVAASLEERGMTERLRGKPFEALRFYGMALDRHRRAGNLRGEILVWELLGELRLNGGEPHEAIGAFVHAGRDANAAKAAEAVGDDSVLGACDFSQARWRRSASFAVVAAVGRTLSPAAVREIAPAVLAEAAKDLESIVTPNPVMRAHEALAAISFELPYDRRDQGLGRLREFATGQYIATARPAAEALMLLTNAGVSDETSTLTAAFLHGDGVAGISPIWIGEQLRDHPAAEQAVASAARDGAMPALEVAAVAGLPSGDRELADLCEEAVSAAVEAQVVEEREEEGQVIRTVGLSGRFELTAILARHVPPELRERLASKMSGLTLNGEIPVGPRTSAANALFNLAAHLADGTRLQIAASIKPLLSEEIRLSPWDDEDPGEFARFRVKISSRAALRGAVLTAWAKLREQQPGTDDEQELLERAIIDPDPVIAQAGYDALALRLALSYPTTAALGLLREEAFVRVAALAAWLRRMKSLPSPPLLRRVFEDEHPAVRLTLLAGTEDLSDLERREVAAALSEDRDAYVRALARRQLRTS